MWDEALQGLQLHETLDRLDGLEASEKLEVGQGNCDLRLMVRVAKFLRVLFMKLAGERFVGVDLKRESFGERKDLTS